MSWILAIDFGTSSTTACLAEDGRVEVIEIDGLRAVPSGVWLADDGSLVVGRAAEHQAGRAPDRWERCPKRWLGEPAPLLLGDTEIAVDVAVSAIFQYVAAEAIRCQGGTSPDEVRLTCPARWGQRRRGALLAAAGRAGLGPPAVPHDPVLVDEPVAAAVHFAARGQLTPNEQVAVYDLGGGTFDTAVLAASPDDDFQVVAVGGIDGLGGEDFDAILYADVLDQLSGKVPEPVAALRDPAAPQGRRAAEHLLREVRRAKEELLTYPSVYLDTGPLVDVPVQLSRPQFERLIRPRIETTSATLLDVISNAHTAPDQLAAVYLAGGSSRIPLVAEVLARALGSPPRVLDEPKSVVAAGAARWHAEAPLVAPPSPPPPETSDALGRRQDSRPSTVHRVGTVVTPLIDIGGSGTATITDVDVHPGQRIVRGDPLLTAKVGGQRLRLSSPCSGVVAAVGVEREKNLTVATPVLQVEAPDVDPQQQLEAEVQLVGRRMRLARLAAAGLVLLVLAGAGLAAVFLARAVSPDPHPPLSQEESRLAGRIPAGVVSGECEPLRDRATGSVTAAVSCTPASEEATRLTTTLYRGRSHTQTAAEQRILQLSLRPGTCDGKVPGQRSWQSGGKDMGTFLCHVSDSTAYLEWTYDDSGIYFVASRSDGSLAKLEKWWKKQPSWALRAE